MAAIQTVKFGLRGERIPRAEIFVRFSARALQDLSSNPRINSALLNLLPARNHHDHGNNTSYTLTPPQAFPCRRE